MTARSGLFSLPAHIALDQLRAELAKVAGSPEIDAQLADLKRAIHRWESAQGVTEEKLGSSVAQLAEQRNKLESARAAFVNVVEDLHEERAALVLTRAELQRDVAERKKTEEALKRSETTFRSLVERMPDPVFAHRDGVLVYGNPAFLAWFGSESAEELVGRTVFDAFVYPADRSIIEERIRISRENDQVTHQGEVRFVRRDGCVRLMDTTGVRLAFDGEPANVVIARDITEQREIQSRLLLSDRMASVGTLAAGIAHEINNPLAYVTANLDMIAEEIQKLGGGSPSGRLKELGDMTNEARQGAERVRKIVRGLKTFSRADEEERRALDVRQVLDLSINMAFNEIRHRARLVKDYGDVPSVEADEARLGQVFINLLVNAAQSMPDGQADRNEIRLITSTDEAGRVVVEVRDTGKGIRRELLGRIFDPFFTTKAIGEGTGLGLSISHNIVTALGGEMTVTSEVGSGTVFRIALPSARVDPVKEMPREARRSVRLRRGRVMVVDDDVAVGTALRRMLAAEHDVTVLTSAREALARISAGEHFDVILCDLMMPEMTGMDLYAELSKVAPPQVDRLIFTTGGAFSPSARHFLDQVANQRFEKPFDVHNLRAAVRAFLR